MGGIQKAINIESKQKRNINIVELEHPNLDNQIIVREKWSPAENLEKEKVRKLKVTEKPFFDIFSSSDEVDVFAAKYL